MSTTLPQEYLKLNWLGSTGTQYIDTDYRPNGHTEIDVSWYWNLDSTSYSRAMFGVDETWHTKSFTQYRDRLFCYGNLVYKADGTSTSGEGNTYRYYYPSGLHHLVFMDQHFNLDDTISINVPYQNFQSSYNLWLFAHNRGGVKEGAGGLDRIKLYSCSIFESGTMVRDFVPCLRIEDNKPGLYDLVSDTFYVNQNTGADFVYEVEVYKTVIPAELTFTDPQYGKKYTPIHYLESRQGRSSNGNGQWINTGLFCTTTDIIEIKGRFTKLKSCRLFGCHRTGNYRRFGLSKSNDVWYFSGEACYGGIKNVLAADTNTHTFIFNHSRNSITIDGVEYAFNGGLNKSGREAPNQGSASDRNTQNKLALFAYRHDADVTPSYGIGWTDSADFQMEYCKITQTNGTVRRDYIPVLNEDGKPGLYDTVSHTFFGNSNALCSQDHNDFLYGCSSSSRVYNGTNEYDNHKTLINK